MKRETRGWIVVIGFLVFLLGLIYMMWAFEYGPLIAAGVLAIFVPVAVVVVVLINLFFAWAFGELDK